MQQIVKVKNKKGIRVIPGFGLSIGITVTMLGAIVLIPLASVFIGALFCQLFLRIFCRFGERSVWVGSCVGSCTL